MVEPYDNANDDTLSLTSAESDSSVTTLDPESAETDSRVRVLSRSDHGDDADDSPERTPDQQEKARRRQELYLKRRREKKRRRIVVQRLSVCVRVVFSFAVLWCAYWGFQQPYWLLDKSHISLTGGDLLPRARVQSLVESFANKPIYAINPQQIERRLKSAFPLIQDVFVRRHINPVGLDVVVTEKPSWGMLYVGSPGRNIPALPAKPKTSDSEPSLTQIYASPFFLERAQPAFLLHWDGSKTDLNRLGVSSPKALEALKHKTVAIVVSHSHPYAAAPSQLRPDMVKRYHDLGAVLVPPFLTGATLHHVDISDPANIIAVYDGFTTYLGRSNSSLINRAQRLAAIVPTIRQYQQHLLFVDLRWNHQVTLRKRSSKVILSNRSTDEARNEDTLPNDAPSAPSSSTRTTSPSVQRPSASPPRPVSAPVQAPKPSNGGGIRFNSRGDIMELEDEPDSVAPAVRH